LKNVNTALGITIEDTQLSDYHAIQDNIISAYQKVGKTVPE